MFCFAQGGALFSLGGRYGSGQDLRLQVLYCACHLTYAWGFAHRCSLFAGSLFQSLLTAHLGLTAEFHQRLLQENVQPLASDRFVLDEPGGDPTRWSPELASAHTSLPGDSGTTWRLRVLCKISVILAGRVGVGEGWRSLAKSLFVLELQLIHFGSSRVTHNTFSF